MVPGNLIVDCAVLLITLCALKHTAKWQVLKRSWWKLWLLGFVADAAGVAWMILGVLPAWIMETWGMSADLWENSLAHVMHNPFAHPAAFAWTLAGVILAGVCIYFFDKRALRSCALLSAREWHIVCLTLAIITAPWLFFIPMY